MLLDMFGILNVLCTCNLRSDKKQKKKRIFSFDVEDVHNVFNRFQMESISKYDRLYSFVKILLRFLFSMKAENIVNEIFKCYLHLVVLNVVRNRIEFQWKRFVVLFLIIIIKNNRLSVELYEQ